MFILVFGKIMLFCVVANKRYVCLHRIRKVRRFVRRDQHDQHLHLSDNITAVPWCCSGERLIGPFTKRRNTFGLVAGFVRAFTLFLSNVAELQKLIVMKHLRREKKAYRSSTKVDGAVPSRIVVRSEIARNRTPTVFGRTHGIGGRPSGYGNVTDCVCSSIYRIVSCHVVTVFF